jgi:hypothetical protein
MRLSIRLLRPKLLACFMACLWLFLATSCRKNRVVNTSFYYWKTVYEENPVEQQYFQNLHCRKLYLRIMDVDVNENGAAVPVSAIRFKSPVADSVQLIPVVFIVNRVLQNQTHKQLDNLAGKIIYYVNGKVKQSGKTGYNELQIDCDWTRTTRANYFYLLRRIKNESSISGKQLSVTLRLHQLKNQQSSGVPPADRVMLMCYNMGNLRKYGTQNSILDQTELEKYLGNNLAAYSMPVDIGLPLFSWAVVFRQNQYIGIAEKLEVSKLNNTKLFTANEHNMYAVKENLPVYGLQRTDEIRWESISPELLQQTAAFVQKHISSDSVNIIYFHLNESTLKAYNYETLEKTAAIFR